MKIACSFCFQILYLSHLTQTYWVYLLDPKNLELGGSTNYKHDYYMGSKFAIILRKWVKSQCIWLTISVTRTIIGGHITWWISKYMHIFKTTFDVWIFQRRFWKKSTNQRIPVKIGGLKNRRLELLCLMAVSERKSYLKFVVVAIADGLRNIYENLSKCS